MESGRTARRHPTGLRDTRGRGEGAVPDLSGRRIHGSQGKFARLTRSPARLECCLILIIALSRTFDDWPCDKEARHGILCSYKNQTASTCRCFCLYHQLHSL